MTASGGALAGSVHQGADRANTEGTLAALRCIPGDHRGSLLFGRRGAGSAASCRPVLPVFKVVVEDAALTRQVYKGCKKNGSVVRLRFPGCTWEAF